MDMYQKRRMRKEKKEKSVEENKPTSAVNINWVVGI